MDRVSTGILGLNGRGEHGFFADHAQFTTFFKSSIQAVTSSANANTKQNQSTPQPAPTKRNSGKKLSYMEQREWDQMENNIMLAEQALSLAQQTAADPSISSSSIKLQEACKTVDMAQIKVDSLYARWAELEAKLKDEP
jgi:ATP-binding cassette subfamily F protein uup